MTLLSEVRAPDHLLDPGAAPDQEPSAQLEPVRPLQALITGLVVLGPLAVTGYVAWWFFSAGPGIGEAGLDLSLALVFYVVAGLGIGVGFHRFFTHSGFTAARPLKIALAIAGTMAVEGSLTTWVAQHRRHHVYSDRAGDPHSPVPAAAGTHTVAGGFIHSHVGWLFRPSAIDAERWCPDLLADADIVTISRYAPAIFVASILAPGAIALGITGRFSVALGAICVAGLARVALFHQVTWSINSICHVVGGRPFRSKDQSRNVAVLALFSFGEAWHNAHHAFPALARHGVDRGQIDISARVIWIFERLGWARGVKWPRPELLARRRI